MIYDDEERDQLAAYLAGQLDKEKTEAIEYRLCTEDDLARLMIKVSCEESIINEWVVLQTTSSWSFQMPTRSSMRSFSLSAAKFLAAGLLLLTVTAASWVGIYYLAAPLFSKAPSTTIVTPTTPAKLTPAAKKATVVKMISGGELRSQNILFVVNDHLKTGQQYHIKKGLLELEMSSGVKIAIAGPTTFQLIDSNNLRLLQGTLTASVPHEAIGFTVNTPTMKTVDLGTTFGVHVNKKGVSETHVFKGIVDCFAVEGEKTISSAKRLTAGKSLQRQAEGELVQSDTKSEELFAECLLQQAGIKNLSGDLKYLPTIPDSLAVCDFTSNDYIHLFAEQQDFILPEDVTCSVPLPNRQGNAGEKQFTRGVIKKGTKINVYYVHFDAHCPGHPQFLNDDKLITAEGEINFNYKILGILQTDGLLSKTDSILGDSKTRYINDKMRQPNVNRASDDKLRLTADDYGIRLQWNLSRKNTIGADCMRVIVAAQK
ncbi:hypothetical protein MNBD_PLANCTO02-36 [hydrothermal vent metagenome]|uniref:FecR protein domain-containing protein n=1 Tax=hydrothermal vent metagenome TaxID=652676 RepID=A0A3B1DGS5_9ZZZZ